MLTIKQIPSYLGALCLASTLTTTTQVSAQEILKVLTPGITMSINPSGVQSPPRTTPFSNIPRATNNFGQSLTGLTVTGTVNIPNQTSIDGRKKVRNCATSCHPHTRGRSDTIISLANRLQIQPETASRVLATSETIGNRCIISLIGEHGIADTKHTVQKTHDGVIDIHTFETRNGATKSAQTRIGVGVNGVIEFGAFLNDGKQSTCGPSGFDTKALNDYLEAKTQ